MLEAPSLVPHLQAHPEHLLIYVAGSAQVNPVRVPFGDFGGEVEGLAGLARRVQDGVGERVRERDGGLVAERLRELRVNGHTHTPLAQNI